MRNALLFALVSCTGLIVAVACTCAVAGEYRDLQPLSQTPGDKRENPDEAKQRHERVAERRGRTHLICHRGAQEFAHENTLEAYRATLELGGDGNEIDIRRTRDGVLVCFHDDMLDRLLDGYGTVPEFDWSQLQQFPFRDPGPTGEHCRIPTLVEVFELHRRHAGLLHLDIKEPGLDEAIVQLLDRLDMWDHVAYCNADNAAAILANPKLKLSRYKAGMYLDRSEVDPSAIRSVLQKPGDGIILEDPRGVLVEMGRTLGSVSREPVAPQPRTTTRPNELPTLHELIAVVSSADDWNTVAETPDDQASSATRIRTRARAAEQILAKGATSPDAFRALEDRVRQRSLHKEWMYHGFDGAMALRALILLRAPNAVELARHELWLDDPALARVHNPKWNTPPSWTDFRLKMLVFPALEKLPGAATERLCRDYLALSDDDARHIGPQQFEAAAKTLLAVQHSTETAVELMHHRLSEVRGRTILECVKFADEPWARAALENAAPYALAYVVRSKPGTP
jgi:hypothetical protein